MIGSRISHYRIEKELGEGGMGVVYRAFDERLRRPVVLKLLSGEATSGPRNRARILAEARAASALNHPGIITIHEVGEEGDQIFLVMELAEGRTLRSILVSETMELRPMLRLGARVAEVLSAAHAAGVIHGDIKPENIMVQGDGRIKLLDFGIARRRSSETVTKTQEMNHSLTEPHIAGTLAYMSPEQLLGGEVDSRSDLFSLGVMLYELTSGHRPFPGPSATALVRQILKDAPEPLKDSAIPEELWRIIHKLLEKQPASRYQSSLEVHVDLTNLIRDLELGSTMPAMMAGKTAIAVLPFKLLTTNPEDEYLSVALADGVINQLSASGQLLVRPTSAIMRYAKGGVDALVAARELNVSLVVEGSIQKIGQQLRVHVQAWKVSDGTTLMSAKHDSEMSKLFQLQDQIGEGLARALGSKPALNGSPEKPPERPTKNVMAYELFLRAAERISRLNRWDTRTAIEMLENATKLDAGFADAWARLAGACLQMGVTFEPGPRWFQKAELAIRHAIKLDPGNADAQSARGQLLWTPSKKFQNQAALRALNKALALNPGCQPALIWRSLVLLHVGLLEEAKEGLLTALAINPDDARTLVFLGQTALYQGKYGESEDYHARALAVDPASLWGNLFYPTVSLYRGDPEGAADKIKAAQQVLPGEPTVRTLEALLWAHRGEKRKAEQAVERALQTGKPVLHTHHMWHNAADVYATIGKPAEAMKWLRRASANGLPNPPLFQNDPHLRSLHNHPAFLRLMTEVGCEWKGYHREFGNQPG
ncbi:MAG: protein kinase [Acidobacteriia bacterium]|nr:protein kinase [Terriglobia bacterium]